MLSYVRLCVTICMCLAVMLLVFISQLNAQEPLVLPVYLFLWFTFVYLLHMEFGTNQTALCQYCRVDMNPQTFACVYA